MTTQFRKILVANRGEIARRIMRTCRRLGISTVAVFSDADAGMPFVREADEAVRIGPPPSTESYLRIDRIVEAAQRTGADAIHPGYGFLAENADLAEACKDAGVAFIGPTADAIRAMGSKRAAKELMTKAGVPVIPGYDGSSQDDKVLAKEARKIGFPVLLKASAGGGGKGMKLVTAEGQLTEAIASARREAQNAFGDGTLLIEKYIERPRHVEIQILGDSHGNLVHLNERECSIQRRHQKIIEETPSPALDASLRAAMGDAAVRCGKAIGYQNAGTVEFVLAPDGKFFFLEVNTRLQVEHPVTECVTGLDLVEEQIRVAQGEALRWEQDEIRLEGSAIEVRLYAEDPAAGFLPQTGRIVDWHLPTMDGLRVDSGVEVGSVVDIHYDPMLAKIITWGDDRPTALRRMRRALSDLSVLGLHTNRELLLSILAHDAFQRGETHTHFIDDHMREALKAVPNEAFERWAAMGATLAAHQRREHRRTTAPHVPAGWRNNFHTPQWVEFAVGARTIRVEYRHLGEGRFVFFEGDTERIVEVVAWDAPNLVLEENGYRTVVRVTTDGDHHFVHRGPEGVALHERPRFSAKSVARPAGACVAPMPGKIIELRVVKGDRVRAGQVLLLMEAMKMEHSVTAPQDGLIDHMDVAVGDQVEADALLAVVAPGEGSQS